MNIHTSYSQPRHCILSLSDVSEAIQQFVDKTHHVENRVVLSDHQETVQYLLPHSLDVSPVKKASLHLGKTYGAVFLDWSQGADINALSIIAGTLHGGGLFVLHLGEDWLNKIDYDLSRYLSWPHTPEQTPSHFKRHVWQHLIADTSPFTITQSYPKLGHQQLIPFSTLTEEQNNLKNAVLASPEKAQFVLCAKRGRGKSTALGHLIESLQKKGSVAVCAPSLSSIATLKKSYESLSKTHLPFWAPDELLKSVHGNDSPRFDYLVVDESAAIPVPMLKALQKSAHVSIFSTTNDGYEGSSRGFGLQFIKYLNTLSSPTISLHLETPIRWVENDAFEIWLNDLLFQSIDHSDIGAHSGMLKLQGDEWLKYPNRLNAAFSLLVQAHYQTSPDNIKWMLDDPSTFSFANVNDDKLTSIAICTEEGDLPKALSMEVMQGVRRPRGHLLPQSLLAHEGIEEAGNFKYWRISRIATQPHKQKEGYGSALLQHIEQEAKSSGIDFLCVSYALTADVLSFWQKNAYIPVRLGYSKDQASGCYSIMMVKALSDNALIKQRKWRNLFLNKTLYSLPLNVWDLETTTLINIFSTSPQKDESEENATYNHKNSFVLNDIEQQDLMLFCDHHRPAATIRSSLLKASQAFLYENLLNADLKEHCHLLEFALGKVTEQDALRLGYSGKKNMIKVLKSTLKQLLVNSNNHHFIE
ncbi:GNAT family N-acetyltransferase [Marinomonas balearica]|uniref:tRNA(Met)-cytidine N(4)-acetyltransferase n=1 Tax=Marinomonas balearica TaxID=491947 RepID=A0A4R6M9N2_9GAMM|nr:GNAT family N-acetyltransferase [Marinomonas balearica]TDO98124.1 tRNA(Met)-cytidine N(4)-acetyltransferase [Marinomonas balearica]